MAGRKGNAGGAPLSDAVTTYAQPVSFSEGIEKAKDMAAGIPDRFGNLFDDAARVIGEIADAFGSISFKGEGDGTDVAADPAAGAGGKPVKSGDTSAALSPVLLVGALVAAFFIFRDQWRG